MPKVVLILQARAGSTRLPGKVLKELVTGKTLLACLLDRLRLSKTASQIVVATTDMPVDGAVAAECERNNIAVFRGSEQDVLGRFVGAARVHSADVIVRLCADSPLLDAEVVDLCVRAFLEQKSSIDYLSNMHPETFPYGLAVEVFPMDVLLRLDRLTLAPELREHVTSLAYKRPELFLTTNVEWEKDLSSLRFAVDYAEDFAFASAVYEQLYQSEPLFSWRRALSLLDDQPELVQINAVRNERLVP